MATEAATPAEALGSQDLAQVSEEDEPALWATDAFRMHAMKASTAGSCVCGLGTCARHPTCTLGLTSFAALSPAWRPRPGRAPGPMPQRGAPAWL